MELHFTFTAELWPWSSNTAMTFVRLPVDDAEDIREFVPVRRGFGSVPVGVQIGDTRWKTSVFPDKENDTFVLPIKKAVRTAQKIEVGDSAEVTITVQLD